MKILLVVFGLLAWGACEDPEKIKASEVFEKDAVWTNMLATDGCSWHFSAKQGDSSINLAASDASLKKIDDTLGKIESAYSFTNVHIKYTRTGKNKEVQCGWGKISSFDEIDILEIHKK